MPRVIVNHGSSPEVHVVAEGTTLHDFMMARHPEGNFPMPVLAMHAGRPVLRGQWPHTVLTGSDVAVFHGLPMGGGGGGSNPLKLVMQVVVIAAAAALTWYAGGAAGWAAAGLYAAAGATAIGGSMLIGAIFKTPAIPSGHLGALGAEAASPTYSLNAATNQARMFQCEPEGIGRIKVIADVVATPWSRYEDNEMWLYQVFGLGRGLSEQHSMAYGDAVFWRDGHLVESAYFDSEDLESIQVETVEPGGVVTIFPDNVETSPSVSGQEMIAPNADNGGWIGPFPANPPGTSTTRILCDFVWQRGVGRFNDRGVLQTYTVDWEIQYQSIDDNGIPLGEWALLHADSISLATLTPQRRTTDSPVPEGRYQVRTRRTSDTTGDSRTMDETRWESLRAVLPGTLTYGQTVVALRLKATNTMSQAASERFSVVQTRKLPVWNPSTRQWSEPVPTRSFAAAIAWVCKSPWGGQLADSRIDLDGLWALDRHITNLGWHLDAWIDGPYSVWSLLTELCAACRVIPRLSGSKLTFAFDGPDRPVRHVFTPRDIVRGSFAPSWTVHTDATPDDVAVTYLDEDAGFAKRDVRAVLPLSESREMVQQSPIGIVNRRHAHDYGVHLAACNRFRRVAVEFQTEAVGRLLNVGDVVSVNHPRLRGAASARVDGWDAKALTITLDKAPEIEGDLYLGLTRRDGSPWGPVLADRIDGDTVIINAQDYAAMVAQGMDAPFSWLTTGRDRAATTAILQTGREYRRRMIVDKITPASLYRYTIHCIADDPRVYSQDVPVPVWQHRDNATQVTSLSAPLGLRGVIEADEEGELTVTLVWLAVPHATGYEAEFSRDGASWSTLGKANGTSMTFETPAGSFHVRVRGRNDVLGPGPWAVWQGDTDRRAPSGQPEIAEPYAYHGGTLALSWNPVPDATRYSVRIYCRSRETPVRATTVTATKYTYTPVMGLADGGPWRELFVEVAAVNESGESSPAELWVDDPVPHELSTAVIQTEAGRDRITFTINRHDEQDLTGYVIARGDSPHFLVDDVLEIRSVEASSYTWQGLTPETDYHFRVAAKDAFFDLARDYGALNYSGSITVTTGDA